MDPTQRIDPKHHRISFTLSFLNQTTPNLSERESLTNSHLPLPYIYPALQTINLDHSWCKLSPSSISPYRLSIQPSRPPTCINLPSIIPIHLTHPLSPIYLDLQHRSFIKLHQTSLPSSIDPSLYLSSPPDIPSSIDLEFFHLPSTVYLSSPPDHQHRFFLMKSLTIFHRSIPLSIQPSHEMGWLKFNRRWIYPTPINLSQFYPKTIFEHLS
jgi:hypothetical protein